MEIKILYVLFAMGYMFMAGITYRGLVKRLDMNEGAGLLAIVWPLSGPFVLGAMACLPKVSLKSMAKKSEGEALVESPSPQVITEEMKKEIRAEAKKTATERVKKIMSERNAEATEGSKRKDEVTNPQVAVQKQSLFPEETDVE